MKINEWTENTPDMQEKETNWNTHLQRLITIAAFNYIFLGMFADLPRNDLNSDGNLMWTGYNSFLLLTMMRQFAFISLSKFKTKNK